MARKKMGRKKAWCKIYRDTGRRMLNKLRKLRKYVRLNPNDKQAANRLKELKG